MSPNPTQAEIIQTLNEAKALQGEWATPWSIPCAPAPPLSEALSGRSFMVPGLSTPVPLIHPDGSGTLRLALMGEAGGMNEQRDLLPFRPYAQAGSVLQRALRETGIERSQCLITNAVWWQPQGNFLAGTLFEFEARDWSRPLNLELFQRHRPRAVLALGASAFYELTGRTEIKVGNGRGFLNWAKPEYAQAAGVERLPVILTYHPSYLARGSGKGRDGDELEGAKVGKQEGPGLGLLGVLKRDLRLALDCARGNVPSPLSLDYRWDPTEQDWEELYRLALSNPASLISYDYETSMAIYTDDETEEAFEIGDVTQVQIAIDPSWAVITRWDREGRARRWFERFMTLPNPKLDVNGRSFDRKITRNLKIPTRGKFIDLQSLWHHLQPDLPRNLQFITSFFCPQAEQWKHLMGVDMKEYGGHDATMPLRGYEGILAGLRGLRHPLSNQSLDASYFRQVLDLELLCLDAYERRGVPVDDERRRALAREMEQELLEIRGRVQPLVPEALRPQKQKEGLSGPPAEFLAPLRKRVEELKTLKRDRTAEWKLAMEGKRLFGKSPTHIKEAEEAKDALETAKLKVKAAEAALAEARLNGPEGTRWETLDADGEPLVYAKRPVTLEDGTEALRWARLEEFNPNSSHQMIKFLRYKVEEEERAGVAKTKRVWKVPVKFGTNDETSGKKELERLKKVTGDPILAEALLMREVKKLQGTYVGRAESELGVKTCDWHPGPDGLVHPFYSTKPATGQLSSEGPNSLNFPKHNKRWFDRIRGMIKAPAGRVVAEIDYRAFHVLTTGFEAGCEKYQRLARLDMHSYFAATRLCRLYKSEELIKLSDADLMRCLKELRADKTPRYNGKDFDFVRGKQAKPCIAEGSLVLTQKGLVPIEKITKDHRLWDGVEWVKHDGVIDRGEKEVLTYDGLTATPDHQVFLQDGTAAPFRDAISKMARLHRTGDGRKAIRSDHRDRIEAEARRRLLEVGVPVPGLRQSDLAGLPLGYAGTDSGLCSMRYSRTHMASRQSLAVSKNTGAAVRCHSSQMRQSGQSQILSLRRAGNREQVQIPDGVHFLGEHQFAPSGLSWVGDRSDRQRWALRTGESPIGHTAPTDREPVDYSQDSVEGRTGAIGRLSKPLQPGSHGLLRKAQSSWSRDHSARESCGNGETEELAKDPGAPRRVRVYDILNAGPRFCFTVNDALVGNCILGYGFGEGPARIYHENEEYFESKEAARFVYDQLGHEFPVVKQWQKNVTDEADRLGYLLTRYGYIRHFHCVYSKRPLRNGQRPAYGSRTFHSGGMEWEVRQGDDYEAAMAFRPANDAFGMCRDVYLGLEEDGLGDEWWISIPLHDAIVFFPPASHALQAVKEVKRRMELPSRCLIQPNGEGLWCETEAMVSPEGGSWAEMRVVGEEELG